MSLYFTHVTLWITSKQQPWGNTVMYTAVYLFIWPGISLDDLLLNPGFCTTMWFSDSPCTSLDYHTLYSWIYINVYMDTRPCSSLDWTWPGECMVMFLECVFLENFMASMLKSYTGKYIHVYLAHVFFLMLLLAPFHSQFCTLAQVVLILDWKFKWKKLSTKLSIKIHLRTN